MYKGQSNEKRKPATKWNWNLFYSKVITRSVNTFIPLGDETISSSLVADGSTTSPTLALLVRPEHEIVPLWFVGFPGSNHQSAQSHQAYRPDGPVRARIAFQFCASLVESFLPLVHTRQGHTIFAIHSRHAAMNFACSSTHSHHEKNHTFLLIFACLHFQCWTNTLYTTLTSIAIMKQMCGPLRFHYACLLRYRWHYRYVTTVLPAFARNVFYGGCSVFIWQPLIPSAP